LVFASSSSVYGLNAKIPFSTEDRTDSPISLYAASKKSNELMAHTYSYLFKIRTTGLRFFTVYGPWGRPDMAMHLFTEAILNNKPLKMFNDGNMSRDFTYIDDTIDACVSLLGINGSHIINIANEEEWSIKDLAENIKKITDSTSPINYIDAPKKRYDYEVERRVGSSSQLMKIVGFKPDVNLLEGLHKIYYINHSSHVLNKI